MKKSYVVAATLSLLLTSFAFAEDGAEGTTPQAPAATAQDVVDKRQENQAKRIENGNLTDAELKKLQHQQGRIQKMEDKMKADGEITKNEMKRLKRAQNNASRDIKRKNHNKRNK